MKRNVLTTLTLIILLFGALTAADVPSAEANVVVFGLQQDGPINLIWNGEVSVGYDAEGIPKWVRFTVTDQPAHFYLLVNGKQKEKRFRSFGGSLTFCLNYEGKGEGVKVRRGDIVLVKAVDRWYRPALPPDISKPIPISPLGHPIE